MRLLAVLFVLAGLARAQVFAGRIIEDHTGEALPSVNVRVVRPGDPYLAADLETDKNGRFQATLPPGEYRLEMERPGYAGAKLPVTHTAAGSNITVRMIKRGVISGRVLDEGLQPIAQALIYAMPKLPNAPLRPPEPSMASATTNGKGEYRMYDLAPGDYVVVLAVGASKRAMASTGRNNMPARFGTRFQFFPSSSRPTVLTVNGGEEYRNIDFTLLNTPFIEISGKVAPADATHRFNIVTLISPEQPALSVAVADAAQDGSFKFIGVVAASSDGSRNGSGFMMPEAALFATATVNGAAEELALVLEAPPPVMFALRNASGCPASATVQLAALEEWGTLLNRTITLKAGQEQEIKGLAPTRYAMVPNKTGTCYLESESILDLTGKPPAQPVVVTFQPGGSVRGKLDAGKQNATGFRVALFPIDDPQAILYATPDAQARFTFDGLRPGHYRLGAFPEGERVSLLSKMVEFEVRGGANAEVDLVVAEGAQ